MMILFQEINVLQIPEQSFSWWDIALGTSNIILALVVARSAWVISVRDRRVHLADKQQDWLIEFRHNIAELMSLQIHMSTRKSKKDVDGLPDMEEYTQRKFQELQRLDYLTKRVLFMFDTKDGYHHKIKITIDACNDHLSKVDETTLSKMSLEHMELRKLIDEIINRQRSNISNLETKNILV